MNQVITDDKRCTRCQVEKDVSQFYGEERPRCKECEKAQKAEYHGSLRGKAGQALQDTRKARRKVEQEQGRPIADTLSIYEVIFTHGEPECAYCGRDTPKHERTIDHIIPMRYGGANSFSNTVMACKGCNNVKSDHPVLAHMLREVPDDRRFIQLVDRIAQRKRQPIGEVLQELSDAARAYYEDRAAKQIERIEKAREGETT